MFTFGVLRYISVHVAQVAQLVEQWTEAPRVGGSIPSLSTIIIKSPRTITRGFLCHTQPPIVFDCRLRELFDCRLRGLFDCRLREGACFIYIIELRCPDVVINTIKDI